MAERGPRTGGDDDVLVRLHDLTGRLRGTGFLADHHGTVITSHEAVEGLPRLVLRGAGDRSCFVTADAVTPLPELDLALVRTKGLGVRPLPVSARDRAGSGTYVRIAAGCWREARVLGAAEATYTTGERRHLLDGVMELAIGTAGRDALRPGGGAAGGPVLDATTGAVIGILGTALRSGHGDAVLAVPLNMPSAGPLADVLAENAATVRARGPECPCAPNPSTPPPHAGRHLVPRQGTGPVLPPERLSGRLRELLHALETGPSSFRAARTLAVTLLGVPDATPYTDVLRRLADLVVALRQRNRALPADLGPAFWTALPLPREHRFDLLRRLVRADGPPHTAAGPRYLDAAARLLAADPVAVRPHLIRWFDDEQPLPGTPHATVAQAAQALLHTYRHRAPDDLTGALSDCAHPRAGELLAALAEDEPPAVHRVPA